MCAADEVALVYAMNGTNRNALAAAGADREVYNGKVVYNLECAVRTGLLTLHTADTAVFALLAGNCTLLVVRALDYYASGIDYELYNLLGAGVNAYSAANAFKSRYLTEDAGNSYACNKYEYKIN